MEKIEEQSHLGQHWRKNWKTSDQQLKFINVWRIYRRRSNKPGSTRNILSKSRGIFYWLPEKCFFPSKDILYWNPRMYFLKSRKIFYWLSRKGFVEEGRVSLARGQILLNSNLFPRPAPNSSPKPFQFAFSSIIDLYCCFLNKNMRGDLNPQTVHIHLHMFINVSVLLKPFFDKFSILSLYVVVNLSANCWDVAQQTSLHNSTNKCNQLLLRCLHWSI